MQMIPCYAREMQLVLSQLDLSFFLLLIPLLTLDPQALLILDDEVLLGLLKLLQFTLCVLRDQSQLLKCLVDLKVFLGHGVSKTSRWRGTLETDGRECRQQ